MRPEPEPRVSLPGSVPPKCAVRPRTGGGGRALAAVPRRLESEVTPAPQAWQLSNNAMGLGAGDPLNTELCADRE